MVTIGFSRIMFICFLKKPIKLYNSITYFAVLLFSLQIFTNVIGTADRVHVTKSIG